MQISPNLLGAIAWMMGALLSFALMAIAVRELSTDMHAFEMLFIRSAIGVAVIAVIFWVKGPRQIRIRRLGGHLLRNCIHFAGQVFWILGISLLPLATVAAIEFTTPIWGTFLAVLFLGERMHRGRWTALVFGFLGILIILRPGLVVVSSGVLIMLACTFCFGATNTVTKWLTRSESALSILFFMVVLQTVFGAIATIFVWTPVEAGHWPMLLLLAATGLTAHYCLVRALAQADASFIMPFEFVRLPLVAVAGFLLYEEAFALTTLVGAALIFVGNTYSLRVESQRGRARG